ncbi:hypothetical protein [Streptomyces luteoverticillatus]|uniref:hypothetical protein n=1 Tax=Streptomyces luteoverticillatus TaxID=66425 RepID=UPI001F0C20E6|nr:hypothetical protein [Streptomyces luteoverticillatus]
MATARTPRGKWIEIEQVESGGGDARARLERLFAIASVDEGPVTGITTEFAIRDWARRDEAVAQRPRRVDNRRMDYLRRLFAAITRQVGGAEHVAGRRQHHL